MSKYDIGVGEAFELDEGQPQDDCGAHHGRHHRHHHHSGHHDQHPHDHDDHHHGRHRHGHHHHAHLAALAMLFALKAYRRSMRPHADPQNKDFS